MTRRPRLQRPDGGDPAPPDPPDPGWEQLELSAPGQSRRFHARHWTAASVTGPALEQARRIAASLGEARGWNTRIQAETTRALAVMLASHVPGEKIPWSALEPALRHRDLSVSRTAEILALADLLDSDRVLPLGTWAEGKLATLAPESQPAPEAGWTHCSTAPPADLGAWLCFEDESGQGLRPPKGRTWRGRGHTPSVRVTGGSNRRVSLAALVAVRPGHRPRLIYRTRARRPGDQRKDFTEKDYARFLDAAHQQLCGPLMAVGDNLNNHVSAVMAGLIAARDWLTVYRLPPYAAELNLEEGV
jgi:DDE superfamily endonuclease